MWDPWVIIVVQKVFLFFVFRNPILDVILQQQSQWWMTYVSKEVGID